MTYPIRAHIPHGAAPRYQAGLTLIELLIAMTLGLLLLFAIGTVYVTSTHTARTQDDYARLQEAGRTALELIGRSVRNAGFVNLSPQTSVFFDPNNPNAISGTNGGSGVAADTIVIQYDGTSGDRSCIGTNIPSGGATVQETFSLSGTDLQCADVVNGGSQTQILLGDIENFQVTYGIDTDGDGTVNSYVNAAALNAVVAPPAAQLLPHWGQVLTVKVCVLVRSQNTGLAPGGQRFLTCNGALAEDVTTADDFQTPAQTQTAFLAAGATAAQALAETSRLRRAFVATFSLRNRIRTNP